jgi:hypothetical protein
MHLRRLYVVAASGLILVVKSLALKALSLQKQVSKEQICLLRSYKAQS